MKRLIISLIALLTLVGMQASRVLSLPETVTQPDGSQVTLIGYGDVHFHWLETTDGALVVNTGNGYYVATVDSDGTLTPSQLLARDAIVRQEQERQLVAAQKQHRARFFDSVQKIQETSRRAQVTSTSYFPHSGSPKGLVILVSFKDKDFSMMDPVKSFDQYMNGDQQQNLGNNEQKNFVGVRKYFETSSHGAFTPDFDVVGPYQLSENMEYYGADISSTSYDKNFGKFCDEALNLASADEKVDFSKYDNNDDGHVELVCIIYAGYGQSANSASMPNTIWPKCSYRGTTLSNGKKVNYVNCSPELFRASTGSDINGIGLFCHEFSHGMGLPDFYATNSAAREVDNQSMEFWDLMDYGEYASNGYAPVPYTAWEQEAMGWLTVEQLTEAQTITGLEPVLKGGKAYKFGNGANDEEYIYMQCVQPRDSANLLPGYVYGHGLLVYHVAYSSSKVNMGDYPNNTAGAPRMAIVPADSLVISGYRFGDGKPYTQREYLLSLYGDPFPGNKSVTELSDTELVPNFKFYNGTAEPQFVLKNITEDTTAQTVTFDFAKRSSTGIATIRKENSPSVIYNLNGQRVVQPGHGLYIINGRKVVM